MNTWLLQANPDIFDVDTYLSDFPYIYWSVPVKKYQTEIKNGDDVFIWRASGSQKTEAGVIAFGIVREECNHKSKIKYPDAIGYGLWREGSSEKSDIKVGIEVVEGRLSSSDGMLMRSDVLEDPLLGKMRVVTSRVGTIFKVPSDQAERLKEKWKNEKGESGYPIESHSWKALSDTVAVKVMDKSSFLHHGSGIPYLMKSFFGLEDLTQGERKEVNLLHRHKQYESHFEIDALGRVRLFWRSDFERLLRQTFPEWYEAFSNEKAMTSAPPLMRFKKQNDNSSYELDFIYQADIVEDIEAEISEEEEAKLEGRIKHYYGKRYERDPVNRSKAIEFHGTACAVCGFDFEKQYGARGRGFIEVHHNQPLSSLEEQQIVNPVTDLVTVCANCHRMIHRRKDDILSVADLRAIIERNDDR